METLVIILSRVEMLVAIIIAGPESIFIDQWSLYFNIYLFYTKQRTKSMQGGTVCFQDKTTTATCKLLCSVFSSIHMINSTRFSL